MPRLVEDYFLRNTQHFIYLSSLPNKKGEDGPGERHLLTRDPARIERFVAKWDQAGRGLFYCVSTIHERAVRRKENYGETTFLHADVDFKSIVGTPQEALDALLNLPIPPTRIHRSGNGLHALWRLSDFITDLDQVEEALRLVRDCVGGDPTVCHVVALMRWPGSHNTKDGAWTEVEVVRDADQDWPIQELMAVFKTIPPVIRRKDADPLTDPFTRAANVMSFKPPMDVDEALKNMTDGTIHTTQLSATASLMNAGHEPEDIVQRVLAATLIAGRPEWNWEEERKKIQIMCDDWAKKHPVPKKKKKVNQQDFRDDGTAEVVNLGEARAEKDAKSGGKKVHVVLGTGILNSLRSQGKELIFSQNQPWLYSDGMWESMKPDEWKSWSARQVEIGCKAVKVVSTQKIVSETRAWIERQEDLHKEPPWDSHGKIATRSGLIDFRTGQVEALQPDHYATHCVECEYAEQAPAPRWLQMLADMGFDLPTQEVLQEILGCALVDLKPRALMRALVIIGPSNSGKSNVLRVMSRLLSDNPITTPLDTLENTHGLQDFLRRAPWVLDEAFDQSKWHFSAAVKALLSGDPVGVNVKNGPFISHVWRSAVLWGSNAPPQFKEASRAMENRMVVVKADRVFDQNAPIGAALEARTRGYTSPAQLVLAEEKAGVLNWALEGLKRAWSRGYLEQTASMAEALTEIRDESNLVSKFFRECVEFDPEFMVSVPDFFAAYEAHYQETGDRHIPSPRSVGRAVAALNDRRMKWGDIYRRNHVRQYVGIKLSEVGLDFWRAAFGASAQHGGSSRISSSEAEVNQLLPPEWTSR